MPAQYTLHVALTKPLVNYVAKQVTSGQYATASEVVRAGLRLLIEREMAEQQRTGALDKPADA